MSKIELELVLSWLLVSVAFCTSVARAQAGPPLFMDDPGTPGPGNWEINVGLTSEINSEEAKFEAPILDLNYGLGERIQLKYEVPWVISQHSGENAQSGVDRSNIGVKYRFLDRENVGSSVSVYPQLLFVGPGANRTITQDEKKEFFLPLEAEQESGKFEFNEELGYRISETQQNRLDARVGATYHILDGLAALIEIDDNIQSDFKDHELLINIGATIELSHKVNILVSGGRDLKSLDGAVAKFFTYLGIQFKV